MARPATADGSREIGQLQPVHGFVSPLVCDSKLLFGIGDNARDSLRLCATMERIACLAEPGKRATACRRDWHSMSFVSMLVSDTIEEKPVALHLP